ncbi:MAG TPA: hypothetical protein VKR58_02845 [Aquella sp.]|nr:hypothetical protein [Aquella sp.]
MKNFLSLYLILFLFTTSIFTAEIIPETSGLLTKKEEVEQPKTTFIENVTNITKLALSPVLALSTNYILDYISSYAHEHGHGIASGGNYRVKIIPVKSIIFPWSGATQFLDRYEPLSLLTILAGPLAGILAIYIQTAALTTFNEYIHKKQTLSTALSTGLKSPIPFFTKAIKTGEQYTSMVINPQSPNPLTNKTLTALTIDTLLFLRMERMITESIYGLLPYHHPTVSSDGETIWHMLLGARAKLFSFTGTLANMAHITIATPYIIGAAQAVYKKITGTSAAQPSQSQRHQSPQTPTTPQGNPNAVSDVSQENEL